MEVVRTDAATLLVTGAPAGRWRWSTRPDGTDGPHGTDGPADGGAVELLGGSPGGAVRIADPDPGRRWYLLVGDQPAVAAERRLPLVGERNMRDLGGLPTGDGRRTRWGTLFRSGQLSALTDDDVRYVRSLGLRTVLDLRTEPEVGMFGPDRLPDGVAPVRLPVLSADFMVAQVTETVRTGRLQDIAPDLLERANRHLVADFAAEYAALLATLLHADGLPAVMHCTTGKDRAGFATAVVLWALGVPHEVVEADYLSSNDYRREANEALLATLRPSIAEASGVAPADLDMAPLRRLLEVDRAYLGAAVAAVHEAYGTVDRYLTVALGCGPAERAALRERLLEPVE